MSDYALVRTFMEAQLVGVFGLEIVDGLHINHCLHHVAQENLLRPEWDVEQSETD